MNSEEDRKRLERQARSLMHTKDIAATDRERINSLMRDQNISQHQRYNEIIAILKKLPDRELVEIEDDDVEGAQAGKSVRKSPVTAPAAKRIREDFRQGIKRYPDINGPTETKLYIDDIYIRFKKYSFFKRRYLARRDNRIGFGWSKRLIPAKKFLQMMNDIRQYHELILLKLPQILERIIRDEAVESPLEFNYLRQFRRWMIIIPFSSVPADSIKWMEQWDFERELKSYIIYFNSFLRLDIEMRERILLTVENYLRDDPDLLKEDMLESDSRAEIARKENENFRKEKYIFEYLGTFRSFMAVPGEADSLLAVTLKKKYGVVTLDEALKIALEALVFQRPFTGTEMREYFQIKPVAVNAELWDMSAARLRIYGRDPETMRRRRAEKLERDLFWFETIFRLVKIEENNRSILIKSADEQWKYADRINRDADDAYNNNFIVFLEGIVHYFKNLIYPILDGSTLQFDYYGDRVEGAVFTADYFREELREIDMLADNIYSFRNINPTLKITFEEAKKIIIGRISSMNHVEGILLKGGGSFYAIGRKLHEVYHNHVKAAGESRKVELRTLPLDVDDAGAEVFIPYSKCQFAGFEPSNRLQRRIAGNSILSDSLNGGIIIFIIAFCYQVAMLCGYPQIQNDIARRDMIKREIRELKGERDDSKI